MRILRLVSLLLFAAILTTGCDDKSRETSSSSEESVDLMVFGPHPDDESLGCAGIMRHALAAGKRVKVVLFTNGDGFPAFASTITRKAQQEMTPQDFMELARYRQNQALKAFAAIGGKAEDVIFLGYPDSGLDTVFETKGDTPYTQKFTQKSETYGVAQRDYHSIAHGKPAPYTHAAALADVVELLQTYKPSRICVTSESDVHRDHKAAFLFLRDAVNAASYRGKFDTYMIHGGPQWPWPAGITPQARLEVHEVKGQQVPLGVSWPPPRRVDLSTEESQKKLEAIRAHSTHLIGATEKTLVAEKEYLESFVKKDEVFWPVKR